MPSNIVKSEKDEEDWNTCKRQADAQGLTGESKWAFTTSCTQKRKAARGALKRKGKN